MRFTYTLYFMKILQIFRLPMMIFKMFNREKLLKLKINTLQKVENQLILLELKRLSKKIQTFFVEIICEYNYISMQFFVTIKHIFHLVKTV